MAKPGGGSTQRDTAAPAPLTPADVDLRDFPFMPLMVARYRDSDLVAQHSLEEIGAATLLWSASWHQVPAGSLPDNDLVLTRFVGLGRDVAAFQAIRAGALHGFHLCSDGRLHHPLIAQLALSSWSSKQQQRWRTECSRIKKHNQRHGTRVASPTFEAFIASGMRKATLIVPEDKSGTSPETPPGNCHQGKETGTGDRESPKEDPIQSEAPSLKVVSGGGAAA